MRRETLHLLLVLRHVQVDERAFVGEEVRGDPPRHLGLPHPGGTEEQEDAHRPAAVPEPGVGKDEAAANPGDRLLLSDDVPVEMLLQPPHPGFGDPPQPAPGHLDRDPHLLGHDAGHVFGRDHGDAHGVVPVGVRRHGEERHPALRAGPVEEIDRLVREEVRRVESHGELDGGGQRLVRDRHAEVALPVRPDPLQDLQRLVPPGLGDLDRLEPALQRRVLLDAVPVLRDRRGADAPQLPAGQRRLHDVPRVHRGPLGAPRPGHRVELVDEQDHLRVRPHLFDHPGQALLELAPVLRPRHHLRHRQLDQPPSREEPAVPPEGDPLRQRLDDGGLPDPRLPHEDGVVLRGHHEDLDELAKGVAGPVGVDERQEAPLPRGPGDVAAVPVQERRLGGKRLRGDGQIPGFLANRDRFLLQLPSPSSFSRRTPGEIPAPASTAETTGPGSSRTAAKRWRTATSPRPSRSPPPGGSTACTPGCGGPPAPCGP